MEHDNMTGDPNQKIPPSIFRFDSYPDYVSNSVFPWATTNHPPKYANSGPQIPNAPLFPNFVPSQPVNPPVAPQVPSSFCFGSPPPSTSSIAGQFPFQITTHGYGDRKFKLLLGKRKTDSPPLQPCKQHITEEKMAEHMSKLHISSETVTSPLEPESVKNKRLYMCEEMRKLQLEPVIPACFVSQVDRPCTALVLWQPPAKIMSVLDDQTDSLDDNSRQRDKNIKSRESAFNNLDSFEMDSEFTGNMEMDA